eukprot:Hpha_TRINITY_DN5220_c0_g1::TRINITY_DN5220_c0_g1_i1::g.116628::m.116628
MNMAQFAVAADGRTGLSDSAMVALQQAGTDQLRMLIHLLVTSSIPDIKAHIERHAQLVSTSAKQVAAAAAAAAAPAAGQQPGMAFTAGLGGGTSPRGGAGAIGGILGAAGGAGMGGGVGG